MVTKRKPLLPFGREDKALLSPDLLACMARVGHDDAVGELVKFLHFNPATPQNFNVFVTGDHASVYDGTCWVSRPLDITMFGIASGLASDIMTHLEANPACVTEEELERFEEYYDTVKYERRDLLVHVADVVRRYGYIASAAAARARLKPKPPLPPGAKKNTVVRPTP